jgi:hypothetical protein
MSFTDVQKQLSDLYGGAASRNADTFQGRIDRLKVGFDEAKESVGVALLPVIEQLIGYIFTYGVPLVDKFKEAWKTVSGAIESNKDNFKEFVFLLQTYVIPALQKAFGFIVDVASKVVATIISVFGTIVGAITPTINFIIDAINKVITGLNYIKPGADIGYISKIGAPSSNFTYGAGNPAVSAQVEVPSIPTTQACRLSFQVVDQFQRLQLLNQLHKQRWTWQQLQLMDQLLQQKKH